MNIDDPPEVRIENVRSQRWIGYDKAKGIISKLNDIATHPKTHRMPGLLIVGDTNAGKTMIAKRFIHEQKKKAVKKQIKPILMVQSPPGPDEAGFYGCIFQGLSEPYTRGRSLSQKLFQTVELLESRDVKLLIIDEIHNIISGTVTKQRLFLNVLKYLSNALQIPIVGLGTKEALRAVRADPQLANRFRPVALPKWKLDKEFLKLLASYENSIPLKKKSNLIYEKMARKLLALSEGNLGELSTLLVESAVYAIKTGEEQINEKILAAVEWILPRDRHRATERLF